MFSGAIDVLHTYCTILQDKKSKTLSKNELKKKSMKKRAVSSDEEMEEEAELTDEEEDDKAKEAEAAPAPAPAEDVAKLTHKDKKKLKKQQEYDKQMELMTKKGGQGASELDSNFTISQMQKTAGNL